MTSCIVAGAGGGIAAGLGLLVLIGGIAYLVAGYLNSEEDDDVF